MRRAWLLLLALLLAGCNLVKLGYGQADHYLSWKLDSYLDLDNAQEDQADALAQRLVTWHHDTQLPQYIALAEQIEVALKNNQAPQAVTLAWQGYPSLRDQLVRQFSRELAPVLKSLRPAQVRHLNEVLAEENADLAERLSRPPAKQAQEREEAALDAFETWLGDLNRNQEQEIARFVASQPDLEPHRLAYRQTTQAQFFLQLPTATASELEELLFTLMTRQDPAHPYAQALAATSLAWQGFLRSFALSLTPRQRAHLLDELHQAQELMRELGGKG